MKACTIWRRRSRATPPWISTTASGRPSRSRVFELGEQHQLAPCAVGLLHQRVIEDPVQLPPLGIGALIHHLLAQLLQLLEGLDLELQLGQGLG
jgi:hypothetical protein